MLLTEYSGMRMEGNTDQGKAKNRRAAILQIGCPGVKNYFRFFITSV